MDEGVRPLWCHIPVRSIPLVKWLCTTEKQLPLMHYRRNVTPSMRHICTRRASAFDDKTVWHVSFRMLHLDRISYSSRWTFWGPQVIHNQCCVLKTRSSRQSHIL